MSEISTNHHHNPVREPKQYEVFKQEDKKSLSGIAELTSRLLDVPFVLICRMDGHQAGCLAKVGVDDCDLFLETEWFRDAMQYDGFCAIHDGEDPPADWRYLAMNSAAGIEFFAGTPLFDNEGHRLGSLCIMDKRTRVLTDTEHAALTMLARLVVDHIGRCIAAANLEKQQNQLLGLIAHELKNSLTVIPAYSEVLRNQVESTPGASRICGQIIRASERMNDLINDMLEMAYLNSTEIRLKRSELNISTLLRDIIANNYVLAKAKKQTLRIDICPGLTIYADETKMAEIADNLINNAIKYSPAGSAIAIRLAHDGSGLVLQVSDQGPGLTASDREKLFQPFTRLSASPTGGESSTGMGLSIVKLLVEAHGGIVSAANNPKRGGCIFSVSIPDILPQRIK